MESAFKDMTGQGALKQDKGYHNRSGKVAVVYAKRPAPNICFN